MCVDRELLFLHTIDELRERLARRGNEYDLMKIATLLRQLLLDREPLVDQVNRNHQLKITFVTTLPASMSNEDLPDPPPLGGPPGWGGSKTVTKDAFLNRFAVWIKPHEYTVKDVILNVAHIKGAVHAGRPRNAKEAELAATSNQVRTFGLDSSVYALLGIGQAVLRGLEPLYQKIKNERTVTGR